jgi:hypothetical protein
MSGTSASGATTQAVPAFKRESYRSWADRYGWPAYLSGSKISSPSQVTTPILFCNKNNTPGYVLDIDVNITSAVTIFVDGDVRLNGNVSVGTATNPVVIIATGSIICKGNPTICGVMWANGTFGNGTPTVYGSIICNNVASFQGNVQLNHGSYPNAQVVPPTDPLYADNEWAVSSWELP